MLYHLLQQMLISLYVIYTILLSVPMVSILTSYVHICLTFPVTDTLQIIIIIIVDTVTYIASIVYSSTLTVTRWTLVIL